MSKKVIIRGSGAHVTVYEKDWKSISFERSWPPTIPLHIINVQMK
jgi:hypothetical protein